MNNKDIETLSVVPPKFTTDIEPWEDGLRSIFGPGTFEWWYFDAILVDESDRKFTCVLMFLTNRPFIWTGKVVPMLSFAIGKPDGTFVSVSTTFDSSDFSQPPLPAGLDLKIGLNSAKGSLNVITIYAEGTGHVYDQNLDQIGQESISANLTLEGLMPAFRIGPPNLTSPPFLAEQVIMPSGNAGGQLTVGASTHTVTGSCYHDHQWGPCNASLSKAFKDIVDNPAIKAANAAYAGSAGYTAAVKDVGIQEIFTAIIAELGKDHRAAKLAKETLEAADTATTAAKLTSDLAIKTVNEMIDQSGSEQKDDKTKPAQESDAYPYWYWGRFTAGPYAGVFSLVFEKNNKFIAANSGLIFGKGKNIFTVYQASESLKMEPPKGKGTSGPWHLKWNDDAQDHISVMFTEPQVIGIISGSPEYRRYTSSLTLQGKVNGENIEEVGDVLWEYFPFKF
jgi:hydroxyneurosporene synthase CrtC